MSLQGSPTTEMLRGEKEPTIPSDPPTSSSARTNETEPNSENLTSSSASDPSTTRPCPPPTPRMQALLEKRAALEQTLLDRQHQRAQLINQARLPSGAEMLADWSEHRKTEQAMQTAQTTIKDHIARLHRYNQIKDIAQGLMGLIADQRGERLKVVQESFGMGDKD